MEIVIGLLLIIILVLLYVLFKRNKGNVQDSINESTRVKDILVTAKGEEKSFEVSVDGMQGRFIYKVENGNIVSVSSKDDSREYKYMEK